MITVLNQKNFGSLNKRVCLRKVFQNRLRSLLILSEVWQDKSVRSRRTIVSGDLKEHLYQISLQWMGNTGQGTSDYKAYDRAYEIIISGKPKILGSSDPVFRGDKTKYNPEELLVASLSSCHMLWYLHLCADVGIVVTNYRDRATGKMCETKNGGGRFAEVILKPEITITVESNLERARQLHHQAHERCFIANSVNFSVLCQPIIESKA